MFTITYLTPRCHLGKITTPSEREAHELWKALKTARNVSNVRAWKMEKGGVKQVFFREMTVTA